jgi:ketosteroid isomerase-like protein
MSEQENLEIVQRGYKAFAEGDLPTLLELLADDAEWNFPPTYVGIPWAQHPCRGRDGVQQAMKMLTELLEFQVFQPDEFIVGRDSVVVLGHERCRVKATGRIVEAKLVQVFTLRDGGSAAIGNTPIQPHGTPAIVLTHRECRAPVEKLSATPEKVVSMSNR